MKKIVLLIIVAITLLSGTLFAAKPYDTLFIWAVSEAPNKPPEMLGNDSTNPAVKLLQADAKARNIAVIFPMMDLTDLNAVSIKDISALSLTPLQSAAKRYQSNQLLIMRITETSQGYEVHALLSVKENPLQLNFQDPTLDGVLKLLIQQTADVMNEPTVAPAAPAATQPAVTKIQMKVIHVMSQDDFLALQDYLQHLTGVTDINIEEMSGAEVMLTLSMQGDQQSLIATIAKDKKLLPVAQAAEPDHLNYQWNP